MEDKKHILFISSWYPNRNDRTHGIFNRSFAEAAALYHKVSVLHVCSDERVQAGLEFESQQENNITTLIVYYKKITATLPVIAQLQKRKAMLNAFEAGFEKLCAQAGKPDLIHLNVVMPAGIGALHLSQKYTIPFIVNECWTGYCPEDGRYKGLLEKMVTKKIIDAAEVIMPVSDYLKNAMLAHGLTGHYVTVPNVVDIHVFTPHAVEVKDTITRFIHISGLDEAQKNVSGIIRAFAQACQANPNLQLNIIGDGDNKAALQALANSLNITDKINFKGVLTVPAVVNEINASHALLMFSNYETFSLVVAEAYACGKPVITSRAGGLTDHVTPDMGITVEKQHEDQLAEALLHFAQHKSSYSGEHLRQFVIENYSKEKIGKQLDDIYHMVLAGIK